jgi:hypothetical protein
MISNFTFSLNSKILASNTWSLPDQSGNFIKFHWLNTKFVTTSAFCVFDKASSMSAFGTIECMLPIKITPTHSWLAVSLDVELKPQRRKYCLNYRLMIKAK